jgi:tyrosine-protein kinase Etk/Wzc
MSVLRSAPVLDSVVGLEALGHHFGTASPRLARERLLDQTRVSAGRDGVVSIQVTDTGSDKAASIANAYVTALERYVVELTNSTARARAEAIRLQLALAQQRLRELDAAFVLVQRRTGVVKLSSEQASGSSSLSDLRQRLAMREAQLTAMSVYATAGNPAHVRISAEAQALRGQIAAIVGQPRGSGGGTDGTGGGADEVQYQRALRAVHATEEAVDGLRKQLVQAEFEAVSRLVGLQVIERASPSEVRSAPRRLLIATVAGLAMLLAVIGWFLWRLRRLQPARGAGAVDALP